MKSYTDTEIIESLRNRQSYIIRYISDACFPKVKLYVKQNGGTDEDARDIFQDTLVNIFELIDKNNFSYEKSFKTTFYEIAQSLWKLVVKKRKEASDYFAKSSNSLKDDKYEKLFIQCFVKLNPIDQNILKLYWMDYSPMEIAEKLGFTYGYIRKRKCTAQAELLKLMKDSELLKDFYESTNLKTQLINNIK